MIGGGTASQFMPYSWLGHWELTAQVLSSTASDVTLLHKNKAGRVPSFANKPAS